MKKALFDRIASDYDYWYATPVGQAVDYVERKAVEELFNPSGKKALEIGCGTGLYTVWLAAEGYDLTAVDISSGMMEIAKQKIRALGREEQVNFLHADIMELLPHLDRYDGILSMTAFEFVPQPEEVLQKLYDRLNPGGCLVIGVIADDNPWSERHRQSAAKDPDSVFHQAKFYKEEEILNWDLGVTPELSKVLYFSPQAATIDEAMAEEAKAHGNPGFLVAKWIK